VIPGFEHSLTIQAQVISRQSGKAIVDAGNKSVADPDALALVPVSPSTVNWYGEYHVVHDDVVADGWPIISRGPGHYGLPGPAI
jgi:D-serine deaminase-like pyridoxal phosphate-dependent protein